MRVLNISYSDSQGGAAIAASQWHNMISDIDGIYSELWVCDKKSNHFNVFDKRKLWAKLIGLKPFKAFSVLTSKVITQKRKAKGLTTLQYFSQLSVNEINASGFDYVHLHWVGFETISCKSMLKINVPIIITLHDNWFINAYHHLGLVKEFSDSFNFKAKLELNHRARLIALSHIQKAQIEKSALSSHAQLHCIGHFVDEDVFGVHNTHNEEPFILVGGSFPFQKEKGGEDLVQFIELCQARGISLKIFGTTEIKKIGKVEYLGIIDKNELAEKMASALVYINFSLQESFSLTALEALASGTPVIGRRVGAIPEMVVEGQTGYLFSSINEVMGCYRKVLTIPRESWRKSCKDRYREYFSKVKVIDKAKLLYGV